MITILSYCDTLQKKLQLSNLIRQIKSLNSEEQILVYSHYQNLEPEFYKGSNYYIFDHTNPISKKELCDWVSVSHQSKRFFRWGSDFGYAVLQMIKRSSQFIRNLGFDKNIILNYDCDISNSQMIEFPELSNSEVGAFARWGFDNNSTNMTYMFLDLNRIKDSFFDDINITNYNLHSNLIPEQILFNLLNKHFNGNWKIIQSLDLTFSGASRKLPEDHYLRSFFHTILPTRNNLPNDHSKCIAIWDCVNPITNITIQIKEVIYSISNEISGENSNLSFFSHLPNVDINEITLLSINAESIEPYKIPNLTETYWRQNYHESI